MSITKMQMIIFVLAGCCVALATATKGGGDGGKWSIKAKGKGLHNMYSHGSYGHGGGYGGDYGYGHHGGNYGGGYGHGYGGGYGQSYLYPQLIPVPFHAPYPVYQRQYSGDEVRIHIIPNSGYGYGGGSYSGGYGGGASYRSDEEVTGDSLPGNVNRYVTDGASSDLYGSFSAQ